MDEQTPQVTYHDQGLVPLTPNSVVGSYLVTAVLQTSPARNEYLIRVAPAEQEEPHANEPILRLIEGQSGSLEHMRQIAYQQLRHPRLLALRETFTVGERDYVVIDTPGNNWPIESAHSIGTENALAVGVLLSEVLSYLHQHGVAHGNIRRDTVIVSTIGVFLTGIEDSTLIIGSAQSPESAFAKDARDLALLLGDLTGDMPYPPGETDTALQAIIDRGKADGYQRVQDVGTDCLKALPDGLPRLTDEQAATPVVVDVGYATTVGRVRQQNQDAIGVANFVIMDDQPEVASGGIYVVADGMGGEAQGEVASRIAARVITAEVTRRFLSPSVRNTAHDTPRGTEPDGEPATMMHLESLSSMTESFRAANARIRTMSRKLDKAAGTTATALMVFGHEAIIGHVGDSRAYLLRGNQFMQLTEDHSLIQKLIDLGHLRPEDAESQVPRNYLYRSLGQGDDLEVDTRVLKIGLGDRFLICSDGLWDLVPPQAMAEVLLSDLSATEQAQTLVQLANAGGGHDNSTALIIRIVAQVRIEPAEDGAPGSLPTGEEG